MNILFVCSRNKWRSRTAETIFKEIQTHSVKSAGTENDARIKVSEKLIQWADLIFVMERKHKLRLVDKFGQLMDSKELIILDIEDDYKYMDSELIAMLQAEVAHYLLPRN